MSAGTPATENQTLPAESTRSARGIDFAFRSATELKQHFKLIGKDFDAIQLSHGPQQGRFRVANLGSIFLVQLQTNQRLLLNGERGADCMSFSFESTGIADEHRLFNIPIAPYSLNGFRQGQVESHFQLSANTTSYLAILSTSRFNAFLNHCNSEYLIEKLEVNNALQISPSLHAKFRKQFEHLIHYPPITSQQCRQTTNHLYSAFLNAISEQTEARYLTYAPSPRQQLVKEFVGWAFSNASQDCSLDQISETLFASRRTLIQGTKESFDMGPMEMMKRVRLEQVNWILRSPDIRIDKNFKTITEVAQHFGFQSRGHFAKAYQQIFHETPSETWLKSVNL
ncbi:helix-turn-helix transcriptional regulator [Synechococcus sp. MIT S9503]|uniref:helix-turn-helix transcriptional regulator n=1 Tax=Synechococcus sp. MIT S9503 TaxID=3082547 RepID=UPI0039A5C25B